MLRQFDVHQFLGKGRSRAFGDFVTSLTDEGEIVLNAVDLAISRGVGE